MKNIIKITILIIAAGYSTTYYAAEQKTAAAKATELSAADAAKIKEYRNAYELFKQTVLEKRTGEADAHLKALETQYENLPLSIRNQLYALIPDDVITYRIGIKPIAREFFKRAGALLTQIAVGTEAPFPPAFLQKPQCPTPPSFLVKPHYSRAQKKEFAKEIEKIYELLLQQKTFSAGETILTYAIRHKKDQLANYLIATRPDLITKPTQHGSFPIHVAASVGNIPIIELLLMKGEDINRYDEDGMTPIFNAVWTAASFAPALITFLATRGANLNVIDNTGNTVLNFAISNPREIKNIADSVKILLDAGVDLNIRKPNILSPINVILNKAEYKDEMDSSKLKEILQLILNSKQLQSNEKLKKSLLNKPNREGIKPLCHAAKIKWTEGAKLLIEHGAECEDDYYKDFLAPLIKKVDAERAKTTYDVLLGETQKTQILPKPVAGIVREYIEGEQKIQAAEPIESAPPGGPSTGPETEID